MAKEKILVVDDEKDICTVVTERLSNAGYEVDSALSGEEALEKVKSKRYNLIFMDMVMPGMDGIETCKAIKKVSPGSILVFMTGQVDRDTILKEMEFLRAGGKVYSLYKPFRIGEVLKVTRQALGKLHLEEE